MTLIKAFQLLSGPVLYCILNCFVPCSLYDIKYYLKKNQRLRYVQIINVWSSMLPKPGHEPYKQIVKMAFHHVKKKSDTSVKLEPFLKRHFKTSIMFPGRVKLLSPRFVYSYLWSCYEYNTEKIFSIKPQS